jgi:hypothetical protein
VRWLLDVHAAGGRVPLARYVWHEDDGDWVAVTAAAKSSGALTAAVAT